MKQYVNCYYNSLLYKKARCIYTFNIDIIFCNKSVQHKTASNYSAFVTTVNFLTKIEKL